MAGEQQKASKISDPMNSTYSQRENDQDASTGGTSAHFLNLPPPPQYQTGAAQSSRMIIDSASYNTTPSHSPHLGPCHDFCVTDCHHHVPDVVALSEADHMLSQQIDQAGLGHFIVHSQVTTSSAQLSVHQSSSVGGFEKQHEAHSAATGPNTPTRGRLNQGGIIPSYMLKSLASSESAGSQARASAQQTLASESASGRSRSHSRHRPLPSRSDSALSAPRQRQLENGTWLVGV